jgi:hypothetical protein
MIGLEPTVWLLNIAALVNDSIVIVIVTIAFMTNSVVAI